MQPRTGQVDPRGGVKSRLGILLKCQKTLTQLFNLTAQTLPVAHYGHPHLLPDRADYLDTMARLDTMSVHLVCTGVVR